VCAFTFLRTKYFDHDMCSFDFFNQITLIKCRTVMSLEVIPTSYFLILLYLVEGITPIGGQEGRWYPQAKL